MRAGALRVVALAGIVGAAASLGLAAPAASAQAHPLAYDLGVVLPGETRTVERPFEVPRDAVVTAARFGSADGSSADSVWTAALCRAECISFSDLHDTTLVAGAYRLLVTLDVPDDAGLELASSASGELTLADAGVAGSTTLPATGGTPPYTTMMIGGLLASAGAFALVAAGRRRDREREAADA